MKLLLIVFLSALFLTSGNVSQTEAYRNPTKQRTKQRALSQHVTTRTVHIVRDCTGKKGVVYFDVDPDNYFDGRGTGVIISSGNGKTHIATAAHVVRSLDKKKRKNLKCKVYVAFGHKINSNNIGILATVRAVDYKQDLAYIVINVDRKVSSRIAKNTFVGERVWSVGYSHLFINPRHWKISMTSGEIATTYIPTDEGNIHRITAASYHGNSGGGTWNVEGSLVGILTGYTGLRNPTGGSMVPFEGYYYIKPIEDWVSMLKKRKMYKEVFGK